MAVLAGGAVLMDGGAVLMDGDAVLVDGAVAAASACCFFLWRQSVVLDAAMSDTNAGGVLLPEIIAWPLVSAGSLIKCGCVGRPAVSRFFAGKHLAEV